MIVLILYAVITSLYYVLFKLYAIHYNMIYLCHNADDERLIQCGFRKKIVRLETFIRDGFVNKGHAVFVFFD